MVHAPTRAAVSLDGADLRLVAAAARGGGPSGGYPRAVSTVEPLPIADAPVAAAAGAEWHSLARRARLLSWISLGWLGFEGVATVLAGALAGSIALVANGLDS